MLYIDSKHFKINKQIPSPNTQNQYGCVEDAMLFNDSLLTETANVPEPSKGKRENLPELKLTYLFTLIVNNCYIYIYMLYIYVCILEEHSFRS